jgi:hypothetical protein
LAPHRGASLSVSCLSGRSSLLLSPTSYSDS